MIWVRLLKRLRQRLTLTFSCIFSTDCICWVLDIAAMDIPPKFELFILLTYCIENVLCYVRTYTQVPPLACVRQACALPVTRTNASLITSQRIL